MNLMQQIRKCVTLLFACTAHVEMGIPCIVNNIEQTPNQPDDTDPAEMSAAIMMT